MQINLDAVTAERCRRSFFHFYCEFFNEVIKGDKLVIEPHIKFVADWMQEIILKLERDEEQKPNLDNQPPSTSKSTLAVALVAWYFTRNPGGRVLYASHNTDLAGKNSELVLNLLQSEKYRRLFPGAFVFKNKRPGITYFAATNGSHLRIASTQKSPIGNHFNLIIVDDPVDPEDALSKVKSAKARSFVNQGLPSRGLNNYATLMIMQRLSESDPAGSWLELHGEEGINWLCLPAEKSHRVRPKEAEAIYNEDGLLAPIRLPKKKLLAQARTLQHTYAGQYDQHPVPLEGGLLKKAWFEVMEEADFREFTKEYNVVRLFDADTAYTDKTKNDPSAVLCSAWVPEEQTLFILDVLEEWSEADKLMPQIEEFVQRNLEECQNAHRSILYIEPKASGKTIHQLLRRESPINVCEAKSPSTDKTVRVNGISAFCAAKKVVIVSDRFRKHKWNEKFLAQLTTVPFAKHDDMTDCLVQAVERILLAPAKKQIRIR